MRWMMKALSLGVLVVMPGCTQSKVDADEEIVLHGKFLDASGAPRANALVSLHRSENSACAFSLFASTWKSMKTNAEGAFSLDLLGADVRNGSVARCFVARTPAREGGGSITAMFLMQQDDVELPELKDWTGSLSATAESDGLSVRYEPLSSTHGGGTSDHVLQVGSLVTDLAWEFPKASSQTRVDDRILEDANNLRAFVRVGRELTVSGTETDVTYYSDAIDLPHRSRIPASRGAACTYPQPETPCRMMNGNLTQHVLLPDGTVEIDFQLAQAATPRKALFRNFATFGTLTELVLEGSADGTTWVSLANLLAGKGVQTFMDVDLSGSTAVTQVRLRATPSSTGARITELGQLSLFE